MDQEEKQQLYARAEQLLSEQNFTAAVIAGAITTVLAAFAYAIIARQWPFSYGFAAVGIGIAIGFAMQYLGRGVDRQFAVVATVFTIVGCLLGNAFREAIFNTSGDLLARLSAIGDIEFSTFLEQSFSYASSAYLVFWLIAVWFAVFLVKRPLSRTDRLALGTYEMRE